MRPVRLELENFGVYRGKHVIDFSPLSFFVIRGRTGAGKSTLMDAICYALYGKAPRYGEQKAHKHLISKGSKGMRVALDFSVKGKVYRIEREHDGGRSDFRFYESGIPKSLKEKELEERIKGLLRLDYGTFTKVLLLPQNQFDRFLKPEDKKDRREILNSLLGFSGLFFHLKKLVGEEYKERSGKLEVLQSRLSQLENVSPQAIEKLEVDMQELQQEYEHLFEKRSQAQKLLESCRERDGFLQEASELDRKLGELLLRREEMEKLRKRLEVALELLPYLPRLEEYERILGLEEKYTEDKRRKELELKKCSEDRVRVEVELRKAEEEAGRLEEYNRQSLETSQTLQLLNSYKELYRESQDIQKQLEVVRGEIERERKAEEECRQRLEKGFELIREVRKEIENYEKGGIEEKIKQVEKKKEQLERLRRLRAERERLERERKNAEEGLEERRRRIEKEREEYQRVGEEIENVERLIGELRSSVDKEVELRELYAKAKELKDVESEKRRLERERESFKKGLEEIKGELSTLEEKKLELYAMEIRSSLRAGSPCPVCGGVVSEEEHAKREEDIRALTSRLYELREKREDLARELSAREAQFSMLEEREQKLIESLRDATKEVHELEERLRKVEKDKALLKKREEELGLLRKTHTEIANKLEELRREESELKERLSSKGSLLEKLREEEEELLVELGGKSEEMLKEDIENTEKAYQELRSLREKEKKYVQRLEELQGELSQKEKRLTELQEREKGLREQKESKEGRLKELEREIREKTGEKPSDYLEIKLRDKIEELSSKIKEAQERYATVSKRLQEVKAKEANLLSDLQKTEEFLRTLQEQKSSIAKELYELNKIFGSLEEAKRHLLSQEEIRNLQQTFESYEKEKHNLEKRLQELRSKLSSLEGLPPTEEVERAFKGLEEELHKNRELYGNLTSELERLKEDLREKKELIRSIEELKKELDLYERLRSDLTDNQFPEFVSRLMLQKVVERANYYLFKFSSGQFSFELVEGDLQVIEHGTGHQRPVSSLSGGETFLASLSLAFAVADILSQNAPLESLFIDEGFGSLDRETRESLSEFFDLIRESTNRMVGIITHVEDVADKFSQRIEIEKKEGSARIKVIY
ncbi:MAG: AAA family ATPase [Aquificaceae bacterium]|nr:AAA family ATPase [Aquificaceae bacterium]